MMVSTQGTKPEGAGPDVKGPVELAIEEARVEAGRLLLRYRVVSRHSRAVYVFNSPTDWFGLRPGAKPAWKDKENSGPTSSLLYVRVDAEQRRLSLWGARRNPGAPRLGPPAPRFPWAARVEAGGQRSYTINLPAPVPAWGPHKMPEPDEMDDVVVTGGKVSLECLHEEHAVAPRAHPESDQLFWVRGSPTTTIEAEFELAEPMTALYWPE